MYKLLLDSQVVQRLEDGAMIPLDLDNVDRQRYLDWLIVGNIPQNPDPAPVISPLSFDDLDTPSKALAFTVASMLKIPADQVKSLFATNAELLSAEATSDTPVVLSASEIASLVTDPAVNQ